MQVIFTTPDTKRACRNGYGRALDAICRIARAYETRPDDRTLVVVLGDPTTTYDPKLRTEGAVFVSPLHDVEPWGDMEKPPCQPPFNQPGSGDEALSTDLYLESFRQSIERALARPA